MCDIVILIHEGKKGYQLMILAGDIGGTKTHLALYQGNQCLYEEKYLSLNFNSLGDLVKQFLSSRTEKISCACFGIAGPVRDGECHATNLPWVLKASELSKELNIGQVFLINDLEANAWGLRALSAEEFLVLNEGKTVQGHAALIAAGTGLGEAGIYWDGKKRHPFACEGGHVDFAPRNELEMELLRYLHKRFGHVSYERVLSGPGLHNLYRFLVEMRLESEEDFTLDPRVITDRALAGTSRACTRALDWFISLYASEAGNLALKLLAVGGVYLGGGIVPKILPFFKAEAFMKAFTAKGRFASLLAEIPVRVILNDNTALLGALEYAKEMRT